MGSRSLGVRERVGKHVERHGRLVGFDLVWQYVVRFHVVGQHVVRFDLVWQYVVRFHVVRFDLVWQYLVWQYLVWQYLVWFHLVGQHVVWFDVVGCAVVVTTRITNTSRSRAVARLDSTLTTVGSMASPRLAIQHMGDPEQG